MLDLIRAGGCWTYGSKTWATNTENGVMRVNDVNDGRWLTYISMTLVAPRTLNTVGSRQQPRVGISFLHVIQLHSSKNHVLIVRLIKAD